MIENVNIYLNYHYQFANILKCVLGCASFMLMEFFLSAIKADSSVKAIIAACFGVMCFIFLIFRSYTPVDDIIQFVLTVTFLWLLGSAIFNEGNENSEDTL